ncbi:hypothetical protein VVR12_06990 [Rothia sp. LK2588]|uniref:hypothetical protein n=1 Tax=Rothia sp. LK2588 TaxID=3114369 RepID=UPI0034CD8D97
MPQTAAQKFTVATLLTIAFYVGFVCIKALLFGAGWQWQETIVTAVVFAPMATWLIWSLSKHSSAQE